MLAGLEDLRECEEDKRKKGGDLRGGGKEGTCGGRGGVSAQKEIMEYKT